MITSRPTNTYTARILRFADADTAVVLIASEFGCHVEKYLRLEGIESWELDGPDRAKAIAARDNCDALLKGRDCLVHLRSRGHDKYARLRGRITVGNTDLATRLVDLGLAWYCSPKDSASQHAAAAAAAAATATVVSGCYTSRDASTLIVQSARGAHSTTNAAAPIHQAIEAAQHATATTGTHFVLYTLAGVALVAIVAALVWLIHNRGKLLGLATTIAAKVP